MRFAADKLVGSGDEVILCHVLVLSPNSVHFADSRCRAVSGNSNKMTVKALWDLFVSAPVSSTLHDT